MFAYQLFQIPDFGFVDATDPLLSMSILGIIVALGMAVFTGALLGSRQLARRQAKRKSAG